MTTSAHSRIPDSRLRLPWPERVLLPITVVVPRTKCWYGWDERCATLCPTQGYCQPGWSR